MANGTVFRGGLPYGPEFARLDEAFPVASLAEGAKVTHERLEGVLGVKRQSGRYYGVVNAWITRQRNQNGVFMVWELTVGLKVLNPAEILDFAETRTRQKIRQTRRAIKTFGYVDRSRLDNVGQRRLDHQLRVAEAIKTSLDMAKRDLAVELAPVKSLPKRLVG